MAFHSSSLAFTSVILVALQESPYAHRVSLVLEEAQVPYDVIPINLVQKPDWFAKKVNTNTGEVSIDDVSYHAIFE